MKFSAFAAQGVDRSWTRPEISVLMTAYNAERYLWEALKSVAEQRTSRRWELLFVDDGSTDGTHDLALKFQHWSGVAMRVLRHPGAKNCGISASRNLAMMHARGPLLTFLDADDVWLPHHLETQARILDANRDVAMVYAGAERWVHFDRPFHEANSRAASWGDNYLPPIVPVGASTGLLPRGRLLRWFTEDESMVPCICTVMVRTAAAREVGGFCDAFRGLYDDQVFHAKLSIHFQVYANDICVARYRQHPVSCCAQARIAPEIQAAEHQKFRQFLVSQTVANRTDELAGFVQSEK